MYDNVLDLTSKNDIIEVQKHLFDILYLHNYMLKLFIY